MTGNTRNPRQSPAWFTLAQAAMMVDEGDLSMLLLGLAPPED